MKIKLPVFTVPESATDDGRECSAFELPTTVGTGIRWKNNVLREECQRHDTHMSRERNVQTGG